MNDFEYEIGIRFRDEDGNRYQIIRSENSNTHFMATSHFFLRCYAGANEGRKFWTSRTTMDSVKLTLVDF